MNCSRVVRADLVAAAIAIPAGLLIAIVDARPTWDDVGVTAGLLAAAGVVAAAISGRRPWLWALLVGGWVPLIEVPATGRPVALSALLFAALGAAIGHGLTRISRARSDRQRPSPPNA